MPDLGVADQGVPAGSPSPLTTEPTGSVTGSDLPSTNYTLTDEEMAFFSSMHTDGAINPELLALLQSDDLPMNLEFE